MTTLTIQSKYDNNPLVYVEYECFENISIPISMRARCATRKCVMELFCKHFTKHARQSSLVV